MPDHFRVLFVEDDDLVRDAIADPLRSAGFEIIEAQSGAQALAIIQTRGDIDALLTDINLGSGPDGWEVALAFREANADKPVIYASGYAPGEHRRVTHSLFFPKPFKVAKVEAALWALLKGAADATAVGSITAQQPLIRLTYMSRPTPLARHPSPSEATLLLGGQARHLNRENGLTGALLVGSKYFIQVLEGQRQPLVAALARISRDLRHEDMRVFELTVAPVRMFSNWAMHLGAVEQVEPELIEHCVRSFEQPSPARANFLIEALAQSVQAAA